MIIAIDAGHGINTAGKRCLKSIDPKETREWWLNNRIATYLEQALMDYDCEFFRVDDISGANDISLNERVNRANSFNADIYLSIHHNAGINGGNGGGLVVYYYSSKAEREIQAKDLYNNILVNNLLKGNRSEPVQKNGFYVLRETKMPAFLIENGFMDSRMDTPQILTDEFARKTVNGIIGFLKSSFLLKEKQNVSNYEKIGMLFEQSMKDLENSKAFQELMNLL